MVQLCLAKTLFDFAHKIDELLEFTIPYFRNVTFVRVSSLVGRYCYNV